MRPDERQSGSRVRVVQLLSTQGLLVEPAYLDQRRSGAEGVLVRALRGNADFWWVRHPDGSMAPYSYLEVQPLEPLVSEGWEDSPL
jgi:hypothetical protein